MSLWNLKEIKLALENNLASIQIEKLEINQVGIDSRSKVENGLFIAIDGEFNDGHKFLSQAFQNGNIAAIVHKIPNGLENDARLILTKNTLQALNNLAIYSQKRFKGKIIGITGSVGKTSVKDMLKTVLLSQGKVFATKGNLNNHFGLPLSLCNMAKDCDFGILEMGMNHSGEIKHLSNIARPNLAIISSINSAHIGNFKDEKEIALAKAEIFSGLTKGGLAIVNGDSQHCDLIKSQYVQYGHDTTNFFTFGTKENCDFKLENIEKCNSQSDILTSQITVSVKNSKKILNYYINSINQITILNSLIAISCLNLIGKDFLSGLQTLKTLTTPQGRGNIIEVQKNNVNYYIIDDSYNANLASVKAGLEFLDDLSKMKNNSRKIAFIGDMLELGVESKKQHKEIANYLTKYKIDKILLIGKDIREISSDILPEKLLGIFSNSLEASEKINFQLQDNDIIFVKGSRGMKMEKLIEKLT